MSLRDGSAKMSKSDPSDNSRINLTDDSDTIAKKFRRARTDPDALPSEPGGLEGRPEAANLVGIYAALSGCTVPDALRDIGGMQFSQFKPRLAEIAVAVLGPIGAEMQRLMADTAYIDTVLRDGAARARALSEPVLAQVFDVVGFVRS